MTKQNFEKMPKNEEAVRELFSDRRNPNQTTDPSLINSNEDEIKQIERELGQKLKERSN